MPTPYEKLAARDVAKQSFLTAEKRDEWKGVFLCDICSREINVTTDARKGKIGDCSWCAKKGGFVSPKAKLRKTFGENAVAMTLEQHRKIPTVEKSAFSDVESRDAALKEEAAFYVEQTKHCLIADFHRLQGALGRDAALAFVQSEVIDPIF